MIKPITTHLTHSFVWGRLYKNLQMRVLIFLKAYLFSIFLAILTKLFFFLIDLFRDTMLDLAEDFAPNWMVCVLK